MCGSPSSTSTSGSSMTTTGLTGGLGLGPLLGKEELAGWTSSLAEQNSPETVEGLEEQKEKLQKAEKVEKRLERKLDEQL